MPFCPLITNNIEINTEGVFKPCCISSKRFRVGDTIANASINTISEVINDNDRANWINNFDQHFKTDCKQCYDVEKSGGESKRQIEIVSWAENYTFESDTLQSLDLKMGNVCNLACAICGPHSSSKWGSIAKQQLGYNYIPPDRWHDTSQFWEELVLHVDSIQRIELAGGEPFMIKKQKILIDFLIEHDIAKNVEITWFTNCTIWPDDLISKFMHFKLVKIMLSIDNTDEKFEFQRYPAQWDQCYDIFKKFIDLRDQGLCQVEISHSVSAINILDLPEFHRWCHDNNVRVFNNLVVHPYNAKDLPEDFKNLVIEKFNSHTLVEPQINPVIGENNWLINLMKEPGNTDILRERLYKVMKTRSGLFEKAFPELSGYLNG